MPVTSRVGRNPEQVTDRLAVGGLRGMLGLPVRLRLPAAQLGQQDERGVLPGAHVAERSRPLAVPGEPRGGQGVQRHPLGAAGQHGLRDADPAVHRLDRPDVEVLAGVARGHHRELLGREVELRAPAGAQQRHQPERLDRRAQVHDADPGRPGRGASGRSRPPRRCRRGGPTPRRRCAPGARAPAGRSSARRAWRRRARRSAWASRWPSAEHSAVGAAPPIAAICAAVPARTAAR